MCHTGSWVPVSELPWLRVAGAHCGWAGAPPLFGMCPFRVGTRDAGDGLREPLGDAQEVYSQVPTVVPLIMKSLTFSEPWPSHP